MFVKTFTVKKNNKEYKYYRIVEAIRKNGMPTYKIILSLGAISREKAERIKEVLASETTAFKSVLDIFPKKAYEFLAVAVVNYFFSFWSLEEVLCKLSKNNRSISYLEIVKALVINRSLEPCSKLQVSQWYGRTFLEKLNNISAKELDENLIYRVMDALLPLEENIQRHLYQKIKEKYPKSFRLVFYDLTSSYFEGIACPLARHGYSRDHRRDKLQIVLGLVITQEGFPFYWEVFSGNQVDITTLKQTVERLKERFSISSCALVADRGLVSNENISNLQGEIPYIMLSDIPKKENDPLNVSAREILSSFTKENLSERLKTLFKYSDELYFKELQEFNGQRNILCFSVNKFLDNKDFRENLLKEVEDYLQALNNALSQAKRNRDYKKLDKQIDQYFKRKKVSRFFKYDLIEKTLYVKNKKGERGISTYEISFSRQKESIDKASIFDGAYLLISDLTLKDKNKNEYTFPPFELIKAYKRRGLIEQAKRRNKVVHKTTSYLSSFRR